MHVVFERDGGMSSLWPPSSPQRSTRLPLLTNRSLLLLQNKGPKEVSQGPKWVNSGIFGNKHENIGFFTPLFWTNCFYAIIYSTTNYKFCANSRLSLKISEQKRFDKFHAWSEEVIWDINLDIRNNKKFWVNIFNSQGHINQVSSWDSTTWRKHSKKLVKCWKIS